jgi:hypothetical protein
MSRARSFGGTTTLPGSKKHQVEGCARTLTGSKESILLKKKPDKLHDGNFARPLEVTRWELRPFWKTSTNS